MIDLRCPEQTFVVFCAGSTLVGIPTTTVDQISTEDPPGSPATLPGTGRGDDGPVRLLILRAQPGTRPLPIRVSGALQMLTLPASQVTELPRLCAPVNSAIVGVALTEEKVLFLIIDPHHLNFKTAGPPR